MPKALLGRYDLVEVEFGSCFYNLPAILDISYWLEERCDHRFAEMLFVDVVSRISTTLSVSHGPHRVDAVLE